jgi:glycosyltransferase involved in cell wall biosynthesis
MFKRHKVRILFAVTNFTYGGIQTQALALAKEYQKKGAKIYFIWTIRYDEDFVKNELFKNNFKIIDGRFIKNKFLGKYSWPLQRYIPLIKSVFLIRFHSIDYVIPYQNHLSCFFGAIHGYTGVKKTIFHIRNTVIENNPKKNWHFNKALKNQPAIVANSNHAKIKFEKVYGKIYDLDIRTIYNGIKIRATDESKDWKKFFAVESIDFVVSVIANFFQEKDFITIFKAWKVFIETTNSNSELLIAGDDGVAGSRKQYEKIVKELGIENKVRFLGRTSYNIELLKVTDVNILSTKNEGLPNSVIETLMAAKPFIGTDVNGIKEVVGESYPIPLFPVGDYVKLSNILMKLYNDEYDLKYIQDYSLDRSQLFSLEKLIENYSNIIRF